MAFSAILKSGIWLGAAFMLLVLDAVSFQILSSSAQISTLAIISLQYACEAVLHLRRETTQRLRITLPVFAVKTVQKRIMSHLCRTLQCVFY